MATTRADMQRLIAQRDQLLKEIEALRNKVSGIEMAISLLEGDTAVKSFGKRQSGLKTLILNLLDEVGTTGLNAATAVEMANRRGVTIQVGSVSSTLSRFKKENIVDYDGERYRLQKFVVKSAPEPATVHKLWADTPRAMGS